MPAARQKKSANKNAGKQTHAFQAETARLLHLLIHSVYSEREVFLRELISNAADACDRLRYEALKSPELVKDDPAFRITIVTDRKAGILSIEDNGIGMSAKEMADNLGVIARSGTRAFIERADGKDAKALIGQFGVGFYAAFMVAGEVEVFSRKAGAKAVNRWHSTGGDGFTGETAPAPDELGSRGTVVRLHISKDAGEFLEPGRIERIVKTYSGHVPVPVSLVEVKDGKRGEPQTLTEATALWRQPRSKVTADAYKEFYGHVSRQFDEPALTIHYRAEGRHEYSVLLFVPSSRPLDLFDPERRGRVRLYVRRVFITDQADMLPPWLRFVRGVVDSEDMPLNISREMLQNNPLVAQIRKALANRILSEFTKLADKDPDKFIALWEAFGAVLKEGIYEEPERRDELYALARFRTTKDPEGWRSLTDYIADMKKEQSAIYYIAGDDEARLAVSPQLEGFRARDIEVLLLSDPVDSFWTMAAAGFGGKPFRSVSGASDDLDKIKAAKDKTDSVSRPPDSAEVAALIAAVKEALGEAVSDVATTKRLKESPCCLGAAQGGLDRRLERLLAQQGGSAPLSAPVLELNPEHPLVAALAAKAKDNKAADTLKDAAWLLYDQARIAEGEQPENPAAFCNRMSQVLEKALTKG